MDAVYRPVEADRWDRDRGGTRVQLTRPMETGEGGTHRLGCLSGAGGNPMGSGMWGPTVKETIKKEKSRKWKISFDRRDLYLYSQFLNTLKAEFENAPIG